MGVPKFFRWLSERNPAVSQVIAENRIPEFDCLYLDMNGIIHNCTHKDSDSPTFRITEDKMFIAIFNYIEHLFGTIKPKKLFFMAIDGVAPRAKMNQQRSRRFRTALEAEVAREKAIREGLEMPKEDAFDSNCITPGTEFMAKLTRQLKYFINKKVSEDADWQGVEVVLSGHEVPGEGEHKIMEYIRQAKSQPNYDPNVRHCLYGLDADLIMLGLLSHDPHFCLLREEVTFGRASKSKSKELEHQNFYLMHLCIVREYLELEFQQLKEPGALPFEFDMESIIDDFILMAFFVGNDFLPNLPYLHINEGALALMFDTYKTVIPKADGYINEKGVINLQRLELLLNELSKVEYRFFESENSDASWLRSKQKLDDEYSHKPVKRGKLVVSTNQKKIWQKVKVWINTTQSNSENRQLDLPVDLAARDREFVKTLADSLNVQWDTVENDSGQRHMRLSIPPKNTAENGEDSEGDVDEEEAQEAILRVTKRYDSAQVVDVSPEQAQEEMERKYHQKYVAWKDKYYTERFTWGLNDEEALRQLTENYVQGLQWVLYYYYRGVASWPWFYKYHYSPMISDVKKGLGANMDFKLGQPFRPFQQLMGVLPDRSKKIVPEAYHELMTNPDSPIIDFYPRDFELDMNGKKQEWEAVVKIPFIEEDRLLTAMGPKDAELTDDERKRNEFGVSLKFVYSQEVNYTYPSSMPGIFNDIQNCRCVENIFELPTMDGLDVYVGLVEGVKLGIAALAGFPSLKTLPFAGELAFHGITVFQQESKNQSMIVTLLENDQRTKVEHAKQKLGKVVYVGYPFLQEAKVTKVSDELFDYTLSPEPNAQVIAAPHDDREIREWLKKSERIESVYSKRLGVIIGLVESLVHVEMLKGLKKTDNGDAVKEYAIIPGTETEYATQTIVDDVISEDTRFIERAALPLEKEFPIQSRAFFLGEAAYGRPLQVIGYTEQKLDIVVSLSKAQNESWARRLVLDAERTTPYTPSYAVAKMLNLSPLVLSKITSAFTVEMGQQRPNLGLNLKFEARKLKVLGYSRRSEKGWEFSQKAINLIVEYMMKFPEFIAGIQRKPQGNTYEPTDFYDAEEAEAKIKEIGQWLKNVETKDFERVPLDADQLDSDTVVRIEQTASQLISAMEQPTNRKMRSVPRHACLKPSDAEQRLNAQKFVTGDRLVYVQDSGKVPVGLTGTVVGLTRTSRVTLLDVVFDSTFMSGTTLGDRCSPFRGGTVPASSVLNLSTRQVIASTRASTARQTQNPTQAYYVNGYGAPTGPGNQAQPLAAHAPPRITQGWSGAVTGHSQNGASPQPNRGRGGARGEPFHNNSRALPIHGGPPPASAGYRGRGGPVPTQNQNFRPGGPQTAPNNKGYTIVDNSDPTEGVLKNNPHFRKQNYTNVPPPSNLDSPRGRGAGRGRGGRGNPASFRGRGNSRGASNTPTQ